MTFTRVERKQVLAGIASDINKKLGEETVVLGSLINYDRPRITSGSVSIDVMLGGGWPANQWSEVIGDESHGKSAIVLKTVAANQARDPDWICVWVASETYDPSWAAKLGVDNGRVIVIDTNIMEDAFQAVLSYLGSRAVDCIVVDSLPALVPSEEGERLMSDAQVGLGARVAGKFFRKQGKESKRSLTDAMDRPCTGLMINQWREKVGVVYGDNRTTPMGRAKNYFFFSRVEVRRDEWIGESEDRYGITIKLRTVKNKSAPPQMVSTVDFYFRDYVNISAGSFDRVKDVANTALLCNVITRAGAFYRYKEDKWQGREALFMALRSDIGMMEEVEKETLVALSKPTVGAVGVPSTPPSTTQPAGSQARRSNRTVAKKTPVKAAHVK